MKASKTYHLAHQLSNPPSPSKKMPSHLQSLPSYIKEEEGSHRLIPSQKQENIFMKGQSTQLKNIDLNNQSHYKFVGIRELKSYQSRTDKKKRNLNSFNKRSSDTVMSFSRVSSTKTAQQAFLTKQELEKKVHASKFSASINLDELFLENKDSSFYQTIGQLNLTGDSLKKKDVEQTLNRYQSQSTSPNVSKIKAILRKYQNEWGSFIKTRGSIEKRAKGNKKYRSVLQYVDCFRESMQIKQKYDLIEKNVHIKPQEWKCVLRSEKSLKSIHQKELIHTNPKGLKLIGKGKSQKQLKWLEDKDRQGYFFRFMPEQQKI